MCSESTDWSEQHSRAAMAPKPFPQKQREGGDRPGGARRLPASGCVRWRQLRVGRLNADVSWRGESYLLPLLNVEGRLSIPLFTGGGAFPRVNLCMLCIRVSLIQPRF